MPYTKSLQMQARWEDFEEMIDWPGHENRMNDTDTKKRQAGPTPSERQGKKAWVGRHEDIRQFFCQAAGKDVEEAQGEARRPREQGRWMSRGAQVLQRYTFRCRD